MTRSLKSKLERSASRRIPFELGRDEKGPCVGYCPYHWHPQIIGNGELLKCLNKKCVHIIMLRPEGSIPKEGIMLQATIVPNKEIYKTESQRRKAEEELRYIGEIVRNVVKEYVQSSLKTGYKDNYNVFAETFYSQNKKNLMGCPLQEYSKSKKEVRKKGRKKIY